LKRIAILIATTGGPVLVDRITPEPAPQSMMCLCRQSEVLPISPDYDDFVRPGSGVIMREFGPYEEGAFRLDVSGPIGTGLSWQLGVFAAHAIFKSDTCELSDLDSADLIVWLSGTVDNDLNVGDVDHMAQKVEASAMVLVDYVAKQTPIIFATGLENAKFLRENQPPGGISVAPIKKTQDLLEILGLVKKKEDKSSNSFWGMAAMVVLAFGALFVFTQGGAEKETEASQDGVMKLDIFSDRGQNPTYYFGEDLNLQARFNQAGWLTCFYEQVDGQTIGLYPNQQVKEDTVFAPEQDHLISAAKGAKFRVLLGPPAGVEIITCYGTKNRISDGQDIPANAAFDKMTVTLKP